MTEPLCPACAAPDLTDFFAVENLPVDVGILLADRDEAAQAARGDIVLAYCHRCGFVFNRIHDPDKVVFAPGYEAFLVHSGIFRDFLAGVADRLSERFDLRGKTILEIGCGSGYFLKMLCAMTESRGIGIDPSIREEGTETVAGGGTVRLIRDRYSDRYLELDPDFICCQSVFEDIPAPLRFLSSMRRAIGTRRIGVYFEVFNAFNAFRNRETWSINYEQCNYFGLESFTALFRRSGFEVLEGGECYEGGQYIYVDAQAAAGGNGRGTAMPAVAPGSGGPPDASGSPGAPGAPGASGSPGARREMPPAVREFGRHHRESMARWQERLAELAAGRRRVVVWGSGCKGINFLNALATAGTIEYVVDINPARQGRYIPGSAQKIVAPELLREYRPQVIIITNVLYEREIRRQVADLGVSCEFLAA